MLARAAASLDWLHTPVPWRVQLVLPVELCLLAMLAVFCSTDYSLQTSWGGGIRIRRADRRVVDSDLHPTLYVLLRSAVWDTPTRSTVYFLVRAYSTSVGRLFILGVLHLVCLHSSLLSVVCKSY